MGKFEFGTKINTTYPGDRFAIWTLALRPKLRAWQSHLCFSSENSGFDPLDSTLPSPPLCFDLYWAKSAVWTHSYYLVEPILPLTDQITPLWSLLKVSGSVVGFKQPTRAWKHTGGANFSGYQTVILAVLEATERKFVANSRLKKAEKINFLWNLVPEKTVLFLPFFLKDPVDIKIKILR